MNISEREFYQYVASATNPEGSELFELVQDDLNVARAFCKSLMLDLYDAIVAEQEDEESHWADLIVATKRYICLHAYDRAIPSLDLVLTPTGFGVVSNANTAPASADRVERLRKQVRLMRDNALDELLDLMRGESIWCETHTAKIYFRSLIWAGKFAAYFGYPAEGRTKLAELSGQIAEAERSLIHIISPELHESLITAIRKDDLLSHQRIAISQCRAYIYAHYSRRKQSIEDAKAALLSYLDSAISLFPEYRDSSAYKANHYKPYANAKEDTCYFFG